MGSLTRDWQAEHDAALDRIEKIAKASPTYNHGNPRYFAMMLAATVSANPRSEAIALQCIEDAMHKCVADQNVARLGGEW